MLAAFYAWWEPHTFLDPDVPELWSALRERGIRIGVLSNTMWSREEHERIFARDGVLDLIDGAVYSSEIPVTKPHREAFAAALNAVGEDDPGRAVFVGDRPFDDIHGAKSAGMRAVLVPHSVIPDDQQPVVGEADAVIQRLADLLPVIDAWLDMA
jgi:putative hydrolase of the HAD superfamily